MAELINILEIIGTIAFAISGALVGVAASLDIFGVIFVGCITSVGGGIVRDVIIGRTPPAIFMNFHICILAMVVSVVVFVVSYIYRKKFETLRAGTEYINNFFDAMGLAAFSVTGAEVACVHGYDGNAYIVIVCGMITGVGGGIFRDILTDTTPYVLKKHIYALASIFGSFAYWLIRSYYESISAASVVSMILVMTIRMLATKYCWSLPKINLTSNGGKQ